MENDFSQSGVVLFVIAVLAGLAYSTWRLVRLVKRDERRSLWPQTLAWIERCETLPGDQEGLCWIVCSYSYTVNGCLLVGDFAVAATRAEASDISFFLRGKNIQVRYNPKRPKLSFVAQDMIGDHIVAQKGRDWFTAGVPTFR